MRKWCEKCGELEAMANPFPWIPGGEARAHRAGCPGGRVIPIATICDPPEPTTIDESDLAPGMVVVAVDDYDWPHREWLCTPDAVLEVGRHRNLVFACRQEGHWYRDGVIVDRYVRRIAGKVTR